MTQPGPFDPDTFAKKMGALATGNPQLQSQPQFAYALTNAGATPQQSSTVNAFLQAQAELNGQSNVDDLATSSLTTADTAAENQQIQQQVNQQIDAAKHPGGIKGFFNHIIDNPVTNNPVTRGLMKATNFTQSALTGTLDIAGAGLEDLGSTIAHPSSLAHGGNFSHTTDLNNSITQQAKAAGYDPNNPFSVAAFMASGQMREDLTDLQVKSDPDTFAQAQQFANDPEAYERRIATDVNLTPDQKVAQLQAINGKEFQDLVKQLSARQSTVGHYLFDTNTTAGKWLAFGTDLAVANKFDPVQAAAGLGKAKYLSPVTLNGMDDVGTVKGVLSGENKSLAAVNRRAGYQYMIDASKQLRDLAPVATGTSDKAVEAQNQIAKIDAAMRRAVPDLYEYRRIFNGTQVPIGYKVGKVTKESVEDPFIWGTSKPMEDLNDAAEFFGSNIGVQRMRLGLPVEQFSAMPGRLSKFGAGKLQGALVAKTIRGALPKRVRIKLDDATVAGRMLATPTDNVPALEGKVADGVEQAPGVLASQQRAANARQVGNAVFASRSGRNVEDVNAGKQLTGITGRAKQLLMSANPKTYNARLALAGQRFSSALNRDEVMTVNGPDMVRKVFATAQIMLPRGYAHFMSGLYDTADEGGRKDILHSLMLSQMHAAGWGTTAGGVAAIAKKDGEYRTALYGATGTDWRDPVSQLQRDSAVWASQLNEKLTLPNMQELLKWAPKIGIWENTIGAALNRPLVTLATEVARIGWVFRAATAVRAVQEDLASAYGRGRLGETLAGYAALRARKAAVAPLKAVQKVRDYADDHRWTAMVVNAGRFVEKHAEQGELLGRKIQPEEWGIGEYGDSFPKEIGQQMISDYMSVHMQQMMNPEADIRAMGRDGFKTQKVRVGFGNKPTADDDGSMGGAQAYSAWLKIMFEDDPTHAMNVMEHVAQNAKKPPAAAKKAAAPRSGPPTKPLDEQVRDAYYELAKPTADNPEPMVSLARIRQMFSDVPREKLDDAIQKIAREEGNLIPESNQKMMTQEQRDAAIQFGGQEKHLITMRHRPPTELPITKPPAEILPEPEPVAKPALTESELLDSWKKSTVAGPNKFSRNIRYVNKDGVDTAVGSDDEKAEAYRQHLQLQIREMNHALTNPKGVLNTKLVQYMRENGGDTPDAFWIDKNIPNSARPDHVVGALYDSVPKERGIRGLIKAISHVSGIGYARLVEAPIARYSVQPQYFANYTRSMKQMEASRARMVDEGLSTKAAMEVSQNISLNRAWFSTLKYVDNPLMRDQLDIVGRAFFAFSRATTAFIRRWSTQFIEDPMRARRLQIAYEAAANTGVLYNDPQGQKQFLFPGSGVLLRAINEGMSKVGLAAYTPAILPNLTSQFSFLNPGLQNPFQYSLTPVGNIPFRAVEKAFPGHREMFDEIDSAINGQISQGESFKQQLEPTVFRNVWQALNPDEQDSMFADSARSAYASLSAAGKTPPPNATSAQLQEFKTQVRGTVKNQLLQRAVFSFFAPAAPSSPTEENDETQADAEFRALGIRSMSDEYKLLVNQMGPAEANIVWTELHPDKLMYEVPTTQAGVKGGNVQATQQSLQWLQQNSQFMKDYSGVAAYFVPQGVQQGAFNLQAFHAELELGLRQYKTTEDYFNQVATANSAADYYQLLDARDQAIAQAPELESAIKKAFSAESADFKAANPLFASTQPDFQGETNTANDQLAQLQQMVAKGDAPKDVPVGDIGQMLDMYSTYHAAVLQFPRQTNEDQAMKAALAGAYNQQWSSFLALHPDLGNVYTGVFRVLDSDVLDSLARPQ